MIEIPRLFNQKAEGKKNYQLLLIQTTPRKLRENIAKENEIQRDCDCT
jgi:hypothetical protein